MNEIEWLEMRLKQKVKVRDDCMKRRARHLEDAEGELRFAMKADEEVVRLMCEIKYRKERE